MSERAIRAVKARVGVKRRWIEAVIMGSSIGLLVLFLKTLVQGTGFLGHALAFVLAGLILLLMQLALGNWTRRGQ